MHKIISLIIVMAITISSFAQNVSGVDEIGSAIQSTTCPHSEITWTKVSEEMSKL